MYVERVRIERLTENIAVYNLEIGELHTYFVADGVLVHNMCKVGKDSETADKIISNGETSGSNSFADMMFPEESTRYEAYWEQNASNYNTPSSKIMQYKIHNDIIEKSIVIYDDFGI